MPMGSRRYTTREVARLVKLSAQRIRSYVRTGVVEGGRAELAVSGGQARQLRFDFRDLLVLRTARRLLDAGLPSQRVERALLALRRQLEEGQPLSSLKVEVEGGRVVVSDGDVRWEPETGQGRLDLVAVGSAAAADRAVPRAALSEIVHAKKLGVGLGSEGAGRRNADSWFNLALDREADDPEGAYEAYMRALACDPEHVEAMINLGRLCSEAGDDVRALAYFRQAIRLQARHPVAHFNLAVTLHDKKDHAGAVAAYKAAIDCDPDFADAHFNLASLLAELGDRAASQEHMDAYRAVVQRREP
ncbi:MAG: tetratricopeptide repeat protein [Deltaproteobacteria bacterium]|nr:tetratricopeptide repeat protein [Deltaproteobacteria bacterium]